MKIYDAKSPLNLKFVKNMHFGHFCITEGDRPFYFTVLWYQISLYGKTPPRFYGKVWKVWEQQTTNGQIETLLDVQKLAKRGEPWIRIVDKVKKIYEDSLDSILSPLSQVKI